MSRRDWGSLLLAVALLTTMRLSGFGQTVLKSGVQGLSTDNADLRNEIFLVYVPRTYTGKEPYGLLVFVNSANTQNELPDGWGHVLDAAKLIYIAPQRVGNDQPGERRMAIPLAGTRALMKLANIDPRRVYVTGLSGGARVGSMLAFDNPTLFSGFIGMCGVNYIRKVPRVKATETDEYGYFSPDAKSAEEAKRLVKFVLVTGSKDFRHGNILDIYEGGFLKDGYQTKLIDVRGMQHGLCSPEVLRHGLDYLDGSR